MAKLFSRYELGQSTDANIFQIQDTSKNIQRDASSASSPSCIIIQVRKHSQRHTYDRCNDLIALPRVISANGWHQPSVHEKRRFDSSMYNIVYCQVSLRRYRHAASLVLALTRTHPQKIFFSWIFIHIEPRGDIYTKAVAWQRLLICYCSLQTPRPYCSC